MNSVVILNKRILKANPPFLPMETAPVLTEPLIIGRRNLSLPLQLPTVKRHSVNIAKQQKSKTRWKERGWRKDGDTLRGEFKGGGYTRRGKILISGKSSPSYRVFIKNPPESLKKGPHGSCYHYDGKEWYWVHFYTSKDMDSCILAVERQLRECSKGK